MDDRAKSGQEPRSVLVLPWHLFDQMSDLVATLRDGGQAAQEVVACPGTTGRAWSDLAELYLPLRDAVIRSPQPVAILSGDCVASLAVLAGLEQKHQQLHLVWFDAHGDFHTESTTTSGYLGGLPLAKAVGRGDLTLPDALGLVPLRENAVTLVDARDLDPPEELAIRDSDVEHVGLDGLDPCRLPTTPLVIHVDVDIVDPTELRGLRFPAPGGPTADEVCDALSSVCSARRVVAIDLAATWDPARADSEQTSNLISSLIDAMRSQTV